MMVVYKGSRLSQVRVLQDANNASYIQFPQDIFSGNLKDIEIIFKEGMRLDNLANQYYGDPQLDWVILQANPGFATPEDIQPGDSVTIPLPKRVIGNV